MSVLRKLDGINPGKPYYGFTKLPVGFHSIVSFRVVKNKFGKKTDGSNRSILAELEDQILFLPQYFWEKLNDDDVRELNAVIDADERVYLYFGGKHKESR